MIAPQEPVQAEVPMTQENLKLLSVSQLARKNFYIPHYQRGYRWDKRQVDDLLKDIDSFTPVAIDNNQQETTFYCLQPLAVKPMGLQEKIEKGFNIEEDWFEVIDGQQRLTTIFIILKYINQMWRGRIKLAQFTLSYETRPGSPKVLNNLIVDVHDDVPKVIINNENIDYYYFSKALETITEWERNNYPGGQVPNFEDKFLNFTKVIWYQVNENVDGRRLFERLNLGKIPLTNSELVKALFLSEQSFPEL